jgi:hypothetical protein
MKVKTFLVALIFALTPAMSAQQPQTPAPGGSQARAEHRQQMMEMHKQEMEAMKSDMGKLKSSLAEMKANILTIREPNELARWRNNADMWETVIAHMDRMQKQMESMGTGMMGPRGPGRGGPPPTPQSEQKPQ